MTQVHAAAFAIFPDRASFETVVTSLRREGFRSSNVSVLFRENRGTWEQTHLKDFKTSIDVGTSSIPAGTSQGALRWLAGIGVLVIPGQGTFVAAGPIRSAVKGTEFSGVHSALVVSLMAMGVPEWQAKRYKRRLSDGWFLLSVQSYDSLLTTRAQRILDDALAYEVVSTSEYQLDDFNSGESIPIEPAIAGSETEQSRSST